jgi:hypothetical protein
MAVTSTLQKPINSLTLYLKEPENKETTKSRTNKKELTKIRAEINQRI